MTPVGVCVDTDGDSVCDIVDNCPADPNITQQDADGDGIGDVCDSPDCGNGLIEAGEFCDDGNVLLGDGCNDQCEIESCGNGTVDIGEACEVNSDCNTAFPFREVCSSCSCVSATCNDMVVTNVA